MNTVIVLMVLAAGQADDKVEAKLVPGGIVANVGDDIITRSELDRRAQRDLVVRGGRRPGFSKSRFDRDTLERMVDDLLILQEAARAAGVGNDPDAEERRITEGATEDSTWERNLRRFVPEADVDYEVEQRIKQLKDSGLGVDSPQKFYDFVKLTSGLSTEAIRSDIRRELAIVRYLRRFVYQRIDTFVSPRESRYYYKKHAKEFTTPIEVSYRQIFLVYDARNTPIKIKLINDGLREGKSFEELAKIYSDDFENSPEFRGQIQTKSFTEIQQYKEPIPAALRSLEKGKYTMPPVATDRNVLYYFLEDRVEGKPKPYEDAQKSIEEKIRVERRRRAEQQFIRRLRDATIIEVHLPSPGTNVSKPASEPEAEKKETPEAPPEG